jgi:membrane protein required for colicin V production
MPITIMDMILVLTIAGFAFTGFWFGLIHMTGSLIGITLAAIVSGQYFEFVAEKLSFLFGGNENLGRVVTFILIFVLVTRLVGVIFWVINKLFHLISIIPGLKTFNRIAGAVLGSIEGIVLVSLSLFMLVRYPLSESFTNMLANSGVVDYLLGVANKVAPLLPDVVEQAKAVIGG